MEVRRGGRSEMVRGNMRLVEQSHEVRYPLLAQQIVQIMIFCLKFVPSSTMVLLSLPFLTTGKGKIHSLRRLRLNDSEIFTASYRENTLKLKK